jgi:hypothetical protein
MFFVPIICPLRAAQRPPALISQGLDSRLAYDADERGNRVPDFSAAGYAGGERDIPDASVRIVVAPVPGDATARIQGAIDYVGGLPADTNGLRGAVLLLKGRHEVSGGLSITNSGVVLRGQGMGEDGTVLVAAGTDRRTLVRVAGRNDSTSVTNIHWQAAEDHVPVGAISLRLQAADGLSAGQRIRVVRPGTDAWIERLGMKEYGGGIGGGWKAATRTIRWEREIKDIAGDTVTLDAPITTALEAGFGGGWVETIEWPGRIRQVGVENLRLVSAFDAANPKDENHSWCAVTIENAEDVWVRQATAEHFAGSMVAAYETARHVTVQDCLSLAPVSEIGGYRRHTFFTMGQGTLFLRCYAENGRHGFAVGDMAAGPNAFVQCEAVGALDDSGPIEAWASGVLYDNVVIDGNALTLGRRGTSGPGPGWAAANCVVWQSSAAIIRAWNPPGAQHWVFGGWAQFDGDANWRSSNDFVSPDSLYAGQLRDRLGSKAAERLQLMPRPREESSNPPIDKAQELAAASHVPPPSLKDYIVAAAKRDPIPCEPGDAPGAPVSDPASQGASLGRAGAETGAPLRLTNGWLTVGGKLLVGRSDTVAWWRGNIRPDESASFEDAITRFVPGRIGPGWTDDLAAVADEMAAKGKASLNHNYGLWYDRRRDDHQRVRRMDGDVAPPFFEQPFARSGQGTAWDGLSKYDLTKFNPWYWNRLRDFAALCDERGLVLFHQQYFQHNILEAGAHWVDSPWRSANNVNGTGFPEPPPFAGDKRIFQAELFYDVTHPVRRELHRRYIRQCLDAFTNRANVIQFTSAEFTGPKAFVEFWLDTVKEWEGERDGVRGRRPMIALSATKDVQDAILADPVRSAVVDVIDFRYWWRTAKGEFAPPGGMNLAPRQFIRQWRGGNPTDIDLAGMAAEYRRRFPGKAVICDFDSAGWAWLCAGGSQPRLPRSTDARLLAAISHMTPRPSAGDARTWVLAEAGRQMLIFHGSNGAVDLSGESGSFSVKLVDPRTGEAIPAGKVEAGGKTRLPEAPLVWLTKD